MRKKVLIALGIVVSLGVGLWLVYAATQGWLFTLSGDYTVSDSAKIEVAGGVAKLKALNKSQDTQAELQGTSPNLAGGFEYRIIPTDILIGQYGCS